MILRFMDLISSSAPPAVPSGKVIVNLSGGTPRDPDRTHRCIHGTSGTGLQNHKLERHRP
jgi:hypothetical protein